MFNINSLFPSAINKAGSLQDHQKNDLEKTMSRACAILHLGSMQKIKV
eukprot:UN01091